MTKRPLKNVAASVHRRLLNKARETGRPFNELLQYYAMERFLYRLSRSPHADKFVLKGALMLVVWEAPVMRPTRDIDLLGQLDNSVNLVVKVARDVCLQEVEDDGMEFDPNTVRGEEITKEADYPGIRVRFEGHLGNAVVHMQVDVGFGDVVLPSISVTEYPTILGGPTPKLRAYTRESTVAEKLHAMVKLGEINSRMRDFYDVWLLSREFDFDGAVLAEAVRRTFARRKTDVQAKPTAFADGFANDPDKQLQWRAFLRRSKLLDAPEGFADIVEAIRSFLGPVVRPLPEGKLFANSWVAPGPWR